MATTIPDEGGLRKDCASRAVSLADQSEFPSGADTKKNAATDSDEAVVEMGDKTVQADDDASMNGNGDVGISTEDPGNRNKDDGGDGDKTGDGELENGTDRNENETDESAGDETGDIEITEIGGSGRGENETDGDDQVDGQTLLEFCHEGKRLTVNVLNNTMQSVKKNRREQHLNNLDKYGYAVIHYIVTKMKKDRSRLLEIMVVNGADVDITTTCRQGRSALHLAVEAKSLECVKTLISLDADVNIKTIYGMTPLDTARAFGSRGQNIELINLDPQNRTDTDKYDEQTKAIIDLLVSVGATRGYSTPVRDRSPASSPDRDPSPSKQNRSFSPAEYRRINTKHYRTLHDSIRTRLQKDSMSPEDALKLVKDIQDQEEYRRRCGSRVLCLDGGGVRGLLQLTILREIERRMKKRIVDMFDWVVGTSTGGIIALALSYGGKTTLELRNIYWLMKEEIFDSSFLANGNTAKLEETLKSWLGSDVTLNQQSYPKVLVPAVYKKDANLELHTFNNCFNDEYSKELVWKVGRFTSAAPFYFTELENYIDGGMLANNPSETALTLIQDHYHKKNEKIPISLVVSVGSGMNPGAPLGNINIQTKIFRPHAWLRAYRDIKSVLEFAVVGKQQSASCQSRCREQGIEYFRFNPRLPEKVESGQHDSTILQNMVLTTRKYLSQDSARQDMDQLVKLLENSDLTSTENTLNRHD